MSYSHEVEVVVNLGKVFQYRREPTHTAIDRYFAQADGIDREYSYVLQPGNEDWRRADEIDTKRDTLLDGPMRQHEVVVFGKPHSLPPLHVRGHR